MNDDEMDELLIQAARDYNEPAFVPREEMWSRISAARGATRFDGSGSSGRRRS